MTRAEKSMEYRRKLKSEHKCIRCGKQDSRTLSGKTCCEICSDKQRIYKANAKYHKKINVGNSNLYQINEIVRKASELGLSYGQYMIKHHSI